MGYTILMTKEDVIAMLKKDEPDDSDWIKTLDTVEIDENGKVIFQGKQFKIIDGVVQKE